MMMQTANRNTIHRHQLDPAAEARSTPSLKGVIPMTCAYINLFNYDISWGSEQPLKIATNTSHDANTIHQLDPPVEA